MRLRALEISQKDTQFYLCSFRAKDIVGIYKVDTWRTDNRNGYQRDVVISRARGFGRFIRDGGVSPSSILLNVRESGVISYKDGYLQIPDETPLWIVDGQHRVKGLKEMIENDGHIDMGEFEFPAVIMNYQNPYEEAKQFVIINRTAKGVRSDLGERFLQRAIEEQGKMSVMARQGLPSSILTGVEWKTRAVNITDRISTLDTSIWKDLIIFPNEPKGDKLVSQKAFSDSLRPILNDRLFERRTDDEITQILINYWNAVKEIWPRCFSDPSSYVLQKYAGVFAVHKLLPKAAQFCPTKGDKIVLTKDSFLVIFERLSQKDLGDGKKFDEEIWANRGRYGMLGTTMKSVSLITDDLSDALDNSLGSGQDIEL
ncbi:hypothetical protein IX51_02335 [uncultured archaeon]|nr:hypothetical protein IX51_02335 [uncultured archaeon]